MTGSLQGWPAPLLATVRDTCPHCPRTFEAYGYDQAGVEQAGQLVTAMLGQHLRVDHGPRFEEQG